MNKHIVNDLETAVISYFSENPHFSLTYNELVGALSLNKTQKGILGELLSRLVEKGTLIKDKRKFSLKQASAPLSADNATTASIKANPNLIEGIFDATPLSRNFSYAFVRTADRDYFIGAEDTLNAYHNDTVALEPKYQKGRQDYGIIRKIIKRASEQLAGDVVKLKNRWTFVCSNPKIHNWFEVSDIGGATEGDKVILSVTNWGSPIGGKLPVGKVTEVLGKSGDPHVELLAVIRQYNLPLEFSTEVTEAANQLSDTLSPEAIRTRRDLRDVFTWTIDPISAKDFDDAISLETTPNGWKLYVHIADVAHYLPVDGVIFEEAAKRGNSFYFPKKVIPLLPERLSNQICSLRPMEEKLCLTVETEFSKKGKIGNQHIYESVIKSDARLAYEEVDALFEGKPHELKETLVDALYQARTLSRLLTEKRNAAGYIYFDLPEIEYQYDENGFVRRLSLSEETESHKLIENFMLVANEFVAQRLSQASPTSIYRIHEDPDQKKLDKLIDLLSNYGVNWVMHESLNKSLQYLLASFPSPEYHDVFDRITLRSMKKARYSTEHLSHFGLALQDYTHFTSPIRRLCDLVVHHLCKIYLIKSSHQKLNQSQIKLYAEIASEQELQADQAERDIDRVYSRTFVKDKIGQNFNGIVVSTSGTGVIVRIKEIPISGIIRKADLGEGIWDHYDREMRYVNRRSNEFYQLMDTLKLQLIAVDDDIYFSPLTEKDAHLHAYKPVLQDDSADRQKGAEFGSKSKKYSHKSGGSSGKRGRRK